ncbi:MAG: glucosaminidase domain-containing protein [Eubacteriales bacterium]|nr:glucosaminidase domain-containing protein [Eubacteriales bacterium]
MNKNKWLDKIEGMHKNRWIKKASALTVAMVALLWTKHMTVKAGSWEYYQPTKSYYYKENGSYLKNRWVGAYYLKADGRMATKEWVYDTYYQSWYYLRADGSFARNEWVGAYYLKKNGKMAKSEWIYDRQYSSWYYLRAEGSYARNEWAEQRYYLKANGKMARHEYLILPSEQGETRYFFGSLGQAYDADRSLQATDLYPLSPVQVIEEVGPLFSQDQYESGILASVSLAQFILESGYAKSGLAQQANNCFGMKQNLSGNTWPGSSWDGSSVITLQTGEETIDGKPYTITANFRRYPSIRESIADHSAYLLGAVGDQGTPRYQGIQGERDYRRAITLIKEGGYATSTTYVDQLCRLIEQWKLNRFDLK